MARKKSLKIEDYSISGLYYRYKHNHDEQIREFLKRIIIVRLQNKGVGSVQGYYPLHEDSLKKIKANPRGQSLTFDAEKTSDKLITGLVEYKKIVYLVKSSSRFFLKPDIGEVFDAINYHDLHGDTIKAIVIHDGSVTLPDTDGEHFLMNATLLVDEDTARRKRIGRNQDNEK
jgi:hypothetical protein